MKTKAFRCLSGALVALVFAAGDTASAQQTQVIIRPLPLYPQISPEEASRYRNETVATRVGIRWNVPGRAVDFAALYRPYAQMASLAYVDAKYSTPELCPSPDALAKAAGADNEAAQSAIWLARLSRQNWQCVKGYIGPLAVRSRSHAVGGLQLHVWRKGNDKGCAIVFRGTDPSQIGDWISNFRWFNRLLPIADQYDQVAEHIKGIIRKNCAGGRVVTVGHSLGGGLAQYAAFRAPRVGYAYTFDPSPVTGFDVPRHDPVPGRKLGIDRVHEAGEILATPRYLIGGFIPARNCRPYTRYVRFNTILTGLGVFQHNMGRFTEQVERRAQLGNAANTVGAENERNCKVDPDRALN